jgi:hypothetical protein
MEVVPAIIFVKDALNETVKVLYEHHPSRLGASERSLREQLEINSQLGLTTLATDCQISACAAEYLTMIVVDPRTSARHAIPSEYFEGRSVAELEFDSDFFRACELSERVAADPVFKIVIPFRGWMKGFIKSEFRAWLRNREIGPLAGPRIRPFFSMSAVEPTSLPIAEDDPEPSVVETSPDKAEPSKQASATGTALAKSKRPAKKRRHDEKRSEVIEALKTLIPSGNLEGQNNKQRCILVNQYLGKPKGWCTVWTLSRAASDYQKNQTPT